MIYTATYKLNSFQAIVTETQLLKIYQKCPKIYGSFGDSVQIFPT